MAKKGAYTMMAISIIIILGVIADFYKRFGYGDNLPMAIAGIGLFAAIAGIVITRIGSASRHA